jgi:hypothetical protein
MSKESKRLRNRAADQLRHGRRAKSVNHKITYTARAAALKALAENEEWLAGEKSRVSKKR